MPACGYPAHAYVAMVPWGCLWGDPRFFYILGIPGKFFFSLTLACLVTCLACLVCLVLEPSCLVTLSPLNSNRERRRRGSRRSYLRSYLLVGIKMLPTKIPHYSKRIILSCWGILRKLGFVCMYVHAIMACR
jgi:hypothetical protein